MNVDRNSDESIVPSNQANKAGTEPAAESAEGSPVFSMGVWQLRGTSARPTRPAHRSGIVAGQMDWQACDMQLALTAR